MDGVDVGRYARLKRVIADKGVKIPPRMEIGFDPEEDKKRFHVSEGGVVVLPKGAGSGRARLSVRPRSRLLGRS